jgi:Bacterial regulatory proteins, tetR family
LTGSQLPWLAPNQRMATESETASSEVNRHLHYGSRDATGADAINGRPLTAKGRATRRRIVDTAADLMVERGVLAVSLDEVGRVTSTSKSQMYHYFASKDDLVAAVVTCVRDRILAFHGDLLIAVDSLEGLRGWTDSPAAIGSSKENF